MIDEMHAVGCHLSQETVVGWFVARRLLFSTRISIRPEAKTFFVLIAVEDNWPRTVYTNAPLRYASSRRFCRVGGLYSERLPHGRSGRWRRETE